MVQKNQGVDEKLSTYIFDLVEKFAGYGFNKSHSAAYALIAYQTAWLKAHYPSAFMSAVLSSDMDNTDKVVNFIEEVKAMKIELLPPDINTCQIVFTVNDKHHILFGLGAIKGAGEAALEGIITEREANGPFKDLFDFCERVDSRKVNKRVLEALIKAGAMDNLGAHRASLFSSIEAAMTAADQSTQNKQTGQTDLFGSEVHHHVEYVPCPPWEDAVRLGFEHDSLGLYFSGHPMDRYQHELKRFTTSTLVKLQPKDSQTILVAGLVVAMRTMQTKRGDRMAFVSLSDNTARIEVAIFPEAYQKYRDILVKNELLVVEGEVSVDEYSGGYKMACKSCYDMTKARELYAKALSISLTEQQMSSGAVERLEEALKPFAGGACPVDIQYQSSDAKARLRLGPQWRVIPSDQLLDAVSKAFDGCNIVY